MDYSLVPRTHRRILKATLARINDRREEIDSMDADELAAAAATVRATQLSPSDQLWLVEPISLACRAAELSLGLRPFEVQTLAAAAIGYGALAEMRTGEGKTLSAALVCSAYALTGRQVHLMTANEYLAARDAAWMSPLYALLGLSSAATVDVMTLSERQAAYTADVVYGTVSQFGFDYLTDQLALLPVHQVQRGRHVAIVDEADAVLLDDARTPLVISTQPTSPVQQYRLAEFVATLDDDDVVIFDEEKSATLSDQGFAAAEQHFGVDDITADPRLLADLFAAVKARFSYHKDRDYLVEEDSIVIVDESTGRTQRDRRWQNGLHEAVEAKEGLSVRRPTTTLATMTVPALIAMYEFRGGMSGTALSDEDEFAGTYHVHVVQIPTNLPSRRVDDDDLLYLSSTAKFTALAAEVHSRRAAGQPVLIGAPTVQDAENVSAALTAQGVSHHVLSAKNPAIEAELIARAGIPSSVVVATNMAGRGVDIVLGGDPSHAPAGVDAHEWAQQCAKNRTSVLNAGGLAVLATARHSSRRIDDQLRGRAGRQGEPGYTRFYLSLDDELLSIYASPTARMAVARALPSPTEGLSHKMVSKLVAAAQEKVENMQRDSRSTVNDYVAVQQLQQAAVYEWRNELLTGDATAGTVKFLSHAFAHLLDTSPLSPRRYDETITTRTTDQGGPAVLDGDVQYDEHDAGTSLDDGSFGPRDIASMLSFTGVQEVPWCDDEVIGWFLDGSSNSAEAIAVRCVDEFLGRNSHIESDQPMIEVLRTIILATVDALWREHVLAMEAMQDVVKLRATAQLDPRVEYARESGRLFEEFRSEMFDAVGVQVSCGVLKQKLTAPAQ
jgi:preprotein translocase subunit SecA